MASRSVAWSVICRVHTNVAGTYNDSCNAVLWVAVLLEVLGNWDEDTWWEGHVEDAVVLLPASLKLLKVLVQLLEALVLVVLAGDVRAHLAEALQLLLRLLGRGLDVGLYSLEIFLVVHLCARISDNLDVFGKELVAVLQKVLKIATIGLWIADTYETEKGWEL